MKLRLTPHGSLTVYVTSEAPCSTFTQASVEVESMCIAKRLPFDINYSQLRKVHGFEAQWPHSIFWQG